VNAVNDAPVNSLPGPQSTNEETALVFSAANGNAISVGDVDDADNGVAGDESLRVTLAAQQGVLSLGSNAGLTFQNGDGSSDASMTFSGTVVDVNNALNGLSYLPGLNFNGASALTITTEDLGNFGVGAPLSRTDSVSVTVNPGNDAPVNTVPGPQSVLEETALVFSVANGNRISVGDVDDADNGVLGDEVVRVTLAAQDGVVSLGSTAGLVFVNGDGSADATVTFLGALANVNGALNGLSYVPGLNFNGTASLTITTDDLGNFGLGGTLSSSASVPIAVNAVNDAPVTEADKVVIVPNTAGPISMHILAPLDVDGDALAITVTATPTNGVVRDAANHLITTGVILSAAQLTGLTFTPANAAGTSSAFTYAVADGHGASDSASAAISVFGDTATTTQDHELITNGGFETGDLTGWTASALGGGSFSVGSTSPAPLSNLPHVGASSGTYFAISDQTSPAVEEIEQSFVVPTGTVTLTLDFDMFVSNWDGPAQIGTLELGAGARQYARVDLLSAGSGAFDLGAVIHNFYAGVDNVTPPAGWTHYTFDITPYVTAGSTYELRFAEADTQANLQQGVDNVSLTAAVVVPPVVPTTDHELITNGGFETGDLTGWTASALGGGSFSVGSTSPAPLSNLPHVGASSGTYFAISDQTSPAVEEIEQSFVVPTGTVTLTLDFDMFVSNWDGPAQIGTLELGAGARQYARVDLLSAGSGAFDLGAVIHNFYAGVDNVTPPAGWTHYTFDITPYVTAGSTYELRFAEADTQANLQQGVDNVSLTAAVASGTSGQNLVGAAGNDVLVGGSASDILTGNGGNDWLMGGGGGDRFHFNNLSDGTDTITDFNRADGDKLDIHDVLQGAGGYNGSNAFSGGFLQFASDGAGGTLVQVDMNGGANSFVTLAHLTNALLTQADTHNYIV